MQLLSFVDLQVFCPVHAGCFCSPKLYILRSSGENCSIRTNYKGLNRKGQIPKHWRIESLASVDRGDPREDNRVKRKAIRRIKCTFVRAVFTHVTCPLAHTGTVPRFCYDKTAVNRFPGLLRRPISHCNFLGMCFLFRKLAVLFQSCFGIEFLLWFCI